MTNFYQELYLSIFQFVFLTRREDSLKNCICVCMNISRKNSRLMKYMVAVFDGSETLTR